MKKKPFKFWLNLLIYVALLFLVWMLIRFDYVKLKDIQIDPFYLLLSIISLFAGYLFLPVAWKNILSKHGIEVSYREAYISEGKPIFAKYLPGKFMVLIGRAGFISLKGYPLTQTSVISFKAQMISLITNLLLGGVALVYMHDVNIVFLVWMALFLFLVLILYVEMFHNWSVNIIKRIFRNNSNISYISPTDTRSAFVWYLMGYLLWGFGFLLLCMSVGGGFDWLTLPVFSLATAVSIIAFLFPGGLGVREGVLVFFLVKTGMNTETATLIALLSRLWFLAGEIFYFVTAIVIKKRIKK